MQNHIHHVRFANIFLTLTSFTPTVSIGLKLLWFSIWECERENSKLVFFYTVWNEISLHQTSKHQKRREKIVEIESSSKTYPTQSIHTHLFTNKPTNIIHLKYKNQMGNNQNSDYVHSSKLSSSNSFLFSLQKHIHIIKWNALYWNSLFI